jgi:multicomponent Na+:H+ antiporter subunit D
VIAAHLPVIQVVLPLLAAPVCVIARRRKLPWLIALATSWLALAVAIALLVEVLAHGPVSYALGGWAAPIGIEYRADLVSAFVLVIVAGITAVILVYAHTSVAHEIAAERHHLFYAALLLSFTGLLGIAITGDAFNAFVFLEISSLSSYALISLGASRRALRAAFQYLVLGTIGATFILIGIGLLYMVTGTLNIVDLGDRLAALGPNRTVMVGFAFITVGLSIKIALFPLHTWLPNVYAYAPSAVTAFLAATTTKVAIYLLLRFFFAVFTTVYPLEVLPLESIFLPLSLIAIAVASTVAIFQADVKRMLAYSSVAQIGYIVLGVSLASKTGLTAAIVHLFNHALMKGGLFLTLGCIFLRVGSVQIADLHGLGRRMPLTMLAFVIGGLSLIGLPLTVGFVSKWTLILAAFERGWWPLAVFVLLTSLLAAAYIWRVVEAAYLHPPAADAAPVREAPPSMVAAAWVLIAACVYFGIDTSLTLGVSGRAAEFLLGLAR